MENMWKVLAVMGIGAGALMLYKIKNPDCIQDMKKSLDNITKSACSKMNDMMK